MGSIQTFAALVSTGPRAEPTLTAGSGGKREFLLVRTFGSNLPIAAGDSSAPASASLVAARRIIGNAIELTVGWGDV